MCCSVLFAVRGSLKSLRERDPYYNNGIYGNPEFRDLENADVLPHSVLRITMIFVFVSDKQHDVYTAVNNFKPQQVI